MTPPDLAALARLIEHFAHYGECYLSEVDADAERWLPILVQTDWVAPLGQDVYLASERLLHLSRLPSEQEWLRYICFSEPAYRSYLLMVLVEGLVLAARADYGELETWIFDRLSHLAPEINQTLDKHEKPGSRLVDWADAELRQFFGDWHQQYNAPPAWNHALLNVHNAHEQMFPAVLERARFFTFPKQARLSDLPPALILHFELPLDAAGRPAAPRPAAWCMDRRHVLSSLPIFDALGRNLYPSDLTGQQLWQDALTHQPYYRAILRVALTAHFSQYKPMPIRLNITADAPDWGHAVIVRAERPLASLAQMIPQVLRQMDCLPLSEVTPADVAQMLQNWSAAGVLTTVHGDIVLTSGYQQALHERQLATLLLRGDARTEQECINKFLREVQHD